MVVFATKRAHASEKRIRMVRIEWAGEGNWVRKLLYLHLA